MTRKLYEVLTKTWFDSKVSFLQKVNLSIWMLSVYHSDSSIQIIFECYSIPVYTMIVKGPPVSMVYIYMLDVSMFHFSHLWLEC